MKICSSCSKEKSLDKFCKSKNRPDGLNVYCKDCTRKKYKSYMSNNPQAIRLKRARYNKWAESHQDYLKERAKTRYAKDPEKVKASVKAWQNAHREEYLSKLSERNKVYRENNPIIIKAIRTRYKALKRKAEGSFTTQELADKIIEWNDKCWICKGAWQAIDHYQPVSKGGTNYISNLRPICNSCNASKKDKWPFEPMMIN